MAILKYEKKKKKKRNKEVCNHLQINSFMKCEVDLT